MLSWVWQAMHSILSLIYRLLYPKPMRKLYSIIRIALALIATSGYGQLVTLKPKQYVFANGGQFMGKTGNVQVYDPAVNMTFKLADFDVATSVQDLVAEGPYLWVSADFNIIKYNIAIQSEEARKYTQDTDPQDDDGQGQEGMGVNHSMTLYKDWLIVTRQFSSGAPEDGHNVRIYNKRDLSLVKKIAVSDQASDVIVVGDSAFVAINGGFMGSTGKLAIIDLKSLQLKEEYNFGANGTGIMQLFEKDRTLYVLAEGKILTYDINHHSHTFHTVGVGHSDFSSSPLATAIVGNKLYGKLNWGAWAGEHKGFGAIDLTTFSITDQDIIGMHEDSEIQNAGYALMASAYDTLDKRFALTFGQWWGDGIGRLYNANGTPAGTFGSVEDSPERMVVSDAFTSHTPNIVKPFAHAAVYPHETYSIDFSTYFADAGGDPLNYYVYMADGSELPSWVTIEGTTLTATPEALAPGQHWDISILAVDPYQLSVAQTLVLKTGETTALNQVAFFNGGQFMGKTGNLQVYDPTANTVSKLADFDVATSVQDAVSEGRYVWVSADYNIIKYDLVEKSEVARKYTQDTNPQDDDGTGAEGMGVNHSMTLYKDWLIATRQFSSGPPEDGFTVRIYDKNDLSLVRKITISNQASDVIVAGDSAFVAINGGFMGTEGKLAIIDLTNLTLKEEYNFGADGTSIMQLLHKDGTLYVLAEGKILTYNIKGHSHALHSVGIGHSDFSSSPLAAALVDNTLYAKVNWGEWAGQHKGFGTIDLTTFAVVEQDIIGMDTDEEILNNGYALMGSAFDTVANRFYFTFGQWWGNGIGRIYTLDGMPAGLFDHVEDSPERLTVSYNVGVNHNPYTTVTVDEINVFEKESYSLTFDELFKDRDGEALVYYAALDDGTELPSWVTFDSKTFAVVDAPKDQAITITVKITAMDARGATGSLNIVVHVTPIDDAPVVAAPPADVVVTSGAQRERIALRGVFTDEDNNEDEMTFSIVGNTHAALVTPVINGSDLALSFHENMSGETIITVRVQSGKKTADADIKVTVREKVVTGIADEAIAIAVFPNPFENVLQVRFGNSYRQATLVVMTATGKTVVRKDATAAEEVLDAQALPAGVYILVVHTPEGDVTTKLVKK
jgi:hypothetical protein